MTNILFELQGPDDGGISEAYNHLSYCVHRDTTTQVIGHALVRIVQAVLMIIYWVMNAKNLRRTRTGDLQGVWAIAGAAGGLSHGDQ